METAYPISPLALVVRTQQEHASAELVTSWQSIAAIGARIELRRR